MKTATLVRYKTSDEGTFGTLTTDTGRKFKTGELPWRDNITDKSCIHPAPYESPVQYICAMSWSPRHNRNVYHVLDVEGRGDVEIHVGNWCGDKDKGYASNVLGCIVVGKTVAKISPINMPPQEAVTASTTALAEFEKEMDGENFQLTISWLT